MAQLTSELTQRIETLRFMEPCQFDGCHVVINSAGRGLGRSLAIMFAKSGASVYLAARNLTAVQQVCDDIRQLGFTKTFAFECDLRDPESVATFAASVSGHTDHIDVLINNGAQYLSADDFPKANDEDIVSTIASGTTGTILTVKHFMGLLENSAKPDIVTVVSAAGIIGNHRSEAHEAFYAAKHGQSGFLDVLSARIRPKGIRSIGLYPPDFDNHDPLSPQWDTALRGAFDPLTAQSVIDCIVFAISQPRDCFIKSFHFEQLQ